MRKTLLVLFCWGVLSTGAAQADPVLFGAFLTGEAEGTGSPGLGVALVSFDAAEQQMGVLAAFEGLLSPSTVGHIHCCVAPPGTAAPATTVPTFPGFPTGVTSGFYAQSFDLTNPGELQPRVPHGSRRHSARRLDDVRPGTRLGPGVLQRPLGGVSGRGNPRVLRGGHKPQPRSGAEFVPSARRRPPCRGGGATLAAQGLNSRFPAARSGPPPPGRPD